MTFTSTGASLTTELYALSLTNTLVQLEFKPIAFGALDFVRTVSVSLSPTTSAPATTVLVEGVINVAHGAVSDDLGRASTFSGAYGSATISNASASTTVDGQGTPTRPAGSTCTAVELVSLFALHGRTATLDAGTATSLIDGYQLTRTTVGGPDSRLRIEGPLQQTTPCLFAVPATATRTTTVTDITDAGTVTLNGTGRPGAVTLTVTAEGASFTGQLSLGQSPTMTVP